MARRTYSDERLNVGPTDGLEPVYQAGRCEGLRIGGLLCPLPATGVEHELNLVVKRPDGEPMMSDEIAIDAVLLAAEQIGAWPARGRYSSRNYGAYDRGRLVVAIRNVLTHWYNDLDKLEITYGLFTAAMGLLAFNEAVWAKLREIVPLAGEILAEKYGSDLHLLVHLSGGDGNTTCATLHLNIPWAEPVSLAAYDTLEAFEHLQESLVRQLAVTASITATGMPAAAGMLTNPRSHRYGRIVGPTTTWPGRSMQFDIHRARPGELYDQEGVGRNMGMCSGWGQSQCANFLTLVLGQLETIRLHLHVVGLFDSRRLLAPQDNLLTLGREFAHDQPLAARCMRAALDDYVQFFAWLQSELGHDVAEDLVPDCPQALRLADQVLTAIEQGDDDTLIRTTDLGKKNFLVDQYLTGRPGGWSENLDGIRNICAFFASPQEVSPYHTFFKPKELETVVLSEEQVQNAGPDDRTRTWFVGEILRRFADDPLIQDIHWDWDQLVLRSADAISGGWIPQIRLGEDTISLPSSVGHNASAIGNLFDRIDSLRGVFEVFGNRTLQT